MSALEKLASLVRQAEVTAKSDQLEGEIQTAARELREELGRTLRRADALKQLIKVAEKRGDDHVETNGGTAGEASR